MGINKRNRKLNRNSSHRKSMFINMMNSLIYYEIIKTTLYKAKELRLYIENIINKSKKNNLSTIRFLLSYIKNKININKLLYVLGPRFTNRNGGYTRIIKCGFRKGDNSPMAYIEIVDRKK